MFFASISRVVVRNLIGPDQAHCRAELNEGADQVNEAAGQVASAATILADGASEQASSLEETARPSRQLAEHEPHQRGQRQRCNELSGRARDAARIVRPDRRAAQ
jgi:methyl-accepting chemotaxis protein